MYTIDGTQYHSSKTVHCACCYNMYLLTLLAFTFHQIFELIDGVYQACRVLLGSKAHLWENLRSTIRMVIVKGWAQLMDLMLNPDDYEVMKLKKY
ncbi:MULTISPECIES: hypothetical protein [unclassified Pseudoalteromonas]|uniref:hypothetical protein n=1 Tax=unclassified Pseudoalteromonas TaxID=194690 RepID=UPI0005A8A3B0|nr:MULTISPECIES: hypothetical protein [unclassified Pseudoalteromonas]